MKGDQDVHLHLFIAIGAVFAGLLAVRPAKKHPDNFDDIIRVSLALLSAVLAGFAFG
jgi:hypothetical protein